MQEIVRSTRGLKSRRLKGKARLNRKITLCLASIICCLSFVAVGVLASLTDVSISIDNDAYYYATAFNKNANDEFIIRTYDDLVAMSNLVNSNTLVPDTHIYYKEAKFYLANDIDPVAEAIANGTSEAEAKNRTYPLSPIGKNSESAFSGEFRGDGHTISNITITLDSTAGFYGGLFGYTAGATISGVGIGTPEDVKSDGTIIPAKSCNFNFSPDMTGATLGAFGTIVGMASHKLETDGETKTIIPTTVTECYNYSNITLNYSGSATIYLGGLVGVSTKQTSVKIDVDNYDPTRLNTWSSIQGIISIDNEAANTEYTTGYAPTVEITNCYNTGNVTLTGTSTEVYASGIACNMPNTFYSSQQPVFTIVFDLRSNYEYAKIRYCYNLGQVLGSEGKTSAISAGFESGNNLVPSGTDRTWENISRLATGVFALTGTGPESTASSTDFYKNVSYLTLDEMSGANCITPIAGNSSTGKMSAIQNSVSRDGETYSAYHETQNTDQMFKFPQLSIFEKITANHPQTDITNLTDSYNHYGIYKTVTIDNFHNFLFYSDIAGQMFMHSNRGENTTTVNHTTLGTSGFVNSSTTISEDCPTGANGEDIELNFKIDSTMTISAKPKSGFMFYGFALIKTPLSEDSNQLTDFYKFFDIWTEEVDEDYLFSFNSLYRENPEDGANLSSTITTIINADASNRLSTAFYRLFTDEAPTTLANPELQFVTNDDNTKTYTLGETTPIYVRRGDDGEGYLEYNGETYYGIYTFYIPQVYSSLDFNRLYTSDEYFNSDKTTINPDTPWNVVTNAGFASLLLTYDYSGAPEMSIYRSLLGGTFPSVYWCYQLSKGEIWGSSWDPDNYFATDDDGRLIYKEGIDPVCAEIVQLAGQNVGIKIYDDLLISDRDKVYGSFAGVPDNEVFLYINAFLNFNANYNGSTILLAEDNVLKTQLTSADVKSYFQNGTTTDGKLPSYKLYQMCGEINTIKEVDEYEATGQQGSGNKMSLKVNRIEGFYYGWNSARQVFSADDTDNNYLYTYESDNLWIVNLVLCDDGNGNPIFRMLGKDGTLSEEYFDKNNKICARYTPNETKLTLHMQVIDEAGNVIPNAVAKRNNQVAINGRRWDCVEEWTYYVGVGSELDTSNPNKPTPPDQGYIKEGLSEWTYTICANSDFVLYADEYFGYNFEGFYVYSGTNPNDLTTGYTKIGNVEYNTETVPVTDDSDPTFARSKYWLQTEAGEVHIYCRYTAASIEASIEGVIGEENDGSSFNLAGNFAGATGSNDSFSSNIGYITIHGIMYVFNDAKTEIEKYTGSTTTKYSKFTKDKVATYSKIYFTITAMTGYKVEGLYLKSGTAYTKIDALTETNKWDNSTTTYVINLAKTGFNVLIGGNAVATDQKTLYVKFAPDNPKVSVGTAYETEKDGSFAYATGSNNEGGYLNVAGKLSKISGSIDNINYANLVGTVAGKGLSQISLVNSYSGSTLKSSYTFTITAMCNSKGYIFKGFYGLPASATNVDFLTSGSFSANVVKITPNSTATDSNGNLNQLICVNNGGEISLITNGVVGTSYIYIYAVFERELAVVDSIMDSGIGESRLDGGTMSVDYAEYQKTTGTNSNTNSENSTNKTQTTVISTSGALSLPISISTLSPYAGIKQGSWLKIYISSVVDGYHFVGYFPNTKTLDATVFAENLTADESGTGYIMYAQVGILDTTSANNYYNEHGMLVGYLYNFMKPVTSGSTESIWVQSENKYVDVAFANSTAEITGSTNSLLYAKFEKTPIEDFLHIGLNNYDSSTQTGSAESDFSHNANGTVGHTSTINTSDTTVPSEVMGEAVVKYLGTTYLGTPSPINNSGYAYTTYNENNINKCNTFDINASVNDLLEIYTSPMFGFKLVDAIALKVDGSTVVYDEAFFTANKTLTVVNNATLNGRTMYKFLGNLPDAKIRVATQCIEISEKGDFTDTVQITKFMVRFKPIDFNINFSSYGSDINGNELIFYDEAEGEHVLNYDAVYYRGSAGATGVKLADYTETVNGESISYLTGFDKKVVTYATTNSAGTLYQNNATGTSGNTGRGFYTARNEGETYPSYIFVGWGVYSYNGQLRHAILVPQATPSDVYATALSTITNKGLSHEIMDTTNFKLSALGSKAAYETLISDNNATGSNSACITLKALWFPIAYNDMEGRTYLVVHTSGDVQVGDTTGNYCNAQNYNIKGSDGKYKFKSVGYDRTIPLEYGKPFILSSYWYLYSAYDNFASNYAGYEFAGYNSHFDENDLNSVQYTTDAQIYADGKNITVSDVGASTSDSLLLSVVINGEAASSTEVNPFTTVETIDGVAYKFIHLYAIYKKTVTYYVGTVNENNQFVDNSTGTTSTLGSSFVENYYFGYENTAMRNGTTQNVYPAKAKAISYLSPYGYNYIGLILKEKLLTNGSYNALLDGVGCGNNSNLLIYDTNINANQNTKTFPLSSSVNTEVCVMGFSAISFNFMRENTEGTGFEVVNNGQTKFMYKLESAPLVDGSYPITSTGKYPKSIETYHQELLQKYNIEFLGWTASARSDSTTIQPEYLTSVTSIPMRTYTAVYRTKITTNFVAPVGSNITSVTSFMQDGTTETISEYTTNATGERIFILPATTVINASTKVKSNQYFYLYATSGCISADYRVYLPIIKDVTFDSTDTNYAEKQYYTFGGWLKDSSKLSRVWDSTTGTCIKWYNTVDYNSKDSDGNYLEQGQESYYIEIPKVTATGAEVELKDSDYNFTMGSSINLYPVFKYHELKISSSIGVQNIFTQDPASGINVENFVYMFSDSDVMRTECHKFVLAKTLSGAGKYTGVYFVLKNTATTNRYINLNYSSTASGTFNRYTYYRVPGDSVMNDATGVITMAPGVTYEFRIRYDLIDAAATLSKFEFWPKWGTSADNITNDLFVTGGKDDLSIASTTTVNNVSVPVCTLENITLSGTAEVWGNQFLLMSNGDKIVIDLADFKASYYLGFHFGGDTGVTQTGFKAVITIKDSAGNVTTTDTITSMQGAEYQTRHSVASGSSVRIELELTSSTQRHITISAGASSSLSPSNSLFRSVYNYGAIREGEDAFILLGNRKSLTQNSANVVSGFLFLSNRETGKNIYMPTLLAYAFNINIEPTFAAKIGCNYWGSSGDTSEPNYLSFTSTDSTKITIVSTPTDGSVPEVTSTSTILVQRPSTTYSPGEVSASYKVDNSTVYKNSLMTATHSDGRAFLGWYTEPIGGVKILDSNGRFDTSKGCVALGGYINSDGTWFDGISVYLYPHFEPIVHKMVVCNHSAQASTVILSDYLSSNPWGVCLFHSTATTKQWSNFNEIPASDITATDGIVSSYKVSQWDYRVYYLEDDGYYLTYNSTNGTYTNKITKFESFYQTPVDRVFSGLSFIGKSGTLYTLTGSSGEYSRLVAPELLEESSEAWGDVTRIIAIYQMKSASVTINVNSTISTSPTTVGGGFLTKNGNQYTSVTFYTRKGGVHNALYTGSTCLTEAVLFGSGGYTISRDAIFETEFGLEQLFYWDGSKAYTVYKNTNMSRDPRSTPTLVLQSNVVTDGGFRITDANGNWALTENITLYAEYRTVSNSAPIIMRFPQGVGDFTISNNTYGDILEIQFAQYPEQGRYYDGGIGYMSYGGTNMWYGNQKLSNVDMVFNNGETKSLKEWISGSANTTFAGISNNNTVIYGGRWQVSALTDANRVVITVCMIYTDNGDWVVAIFGLPETKRYSSSSIKYSLTMTSYSAIGAYTGTEYAYQKMFSNPAINYLQVGDYSDTKYLMENNGFKRAYISNTTSSMEFSTIYNSNSDFFLMKVNTELVKITCGQVIVHEDGTKTYKTMSHHSTLADAFSYASKNNAVHQIELLSDITEKSNVPLIWDCSGRDPYLGLTFFGRSHTIYYDSDYPITIIANTGQTYSFQVLNLDVVVSEDAVYSNEYIFDVKSTSTWSPERYFNFINCNIVNNKDGGGGVRADFTEKGEGYWTRFRSGTTITTKGTAVLYKGSNSKGNGGIEVNSANITSYNSYAVYCTRTYYLNLSGNSVIQNYSSTLPTIYVEDMNASYGRMALWNATIRNLGKVGATTASCIEVKNTLLRGDSGTSYIEGTGKGISLYGSAVLRYNAEFNNNIVFNCDDCDVYLGSTSATGSTPIEINTLSNTTGLVPLNIKANSVITSFNVRTNSATIRTNVKNYSLISVGGGFTVADSGSTNLVYSLKSITLILDRTLSNAPSTSDKTLDTSSVPKITFIDSTGTNIPQVTSLESLKAKKVVLTLLKNNNSSDLVYATFYTTQSATYEPVAVVVDGLTYAKKTSGGSTYYYNDSNQVSLYLSSSYAPVVEDASWEQLYSGQILIQIAIPNGYNQVQISVDGAKNVYTASTNTAISGSSNCYSATHGTIYFWWNDK